MNDKTKSKFKLKLEWLWTPLLILVVYVLSVGPACKLESMGVVPHAALKAFYAPLEFLANNTEMGRDVFGWYIFEVCRVPVPFYPK